MATHGPDLSVDHLNEVVINDVHIQALDVLRILRRLCRKVCELPDVDLGSPLSGFELASIFTLCYRVHNGTPHECEIKRQFRTRDMDNFMRTGELPYYVKRTLIVGFTRAEVPDSLVRQYQLLCKESDEPVPVYRDTQINPVLRKYLLPDRER